MVIVLRNKEGGGALNCFDVGNISFVSGIVDACSSPWFLDAHTKHFSVWPYQVQVY